MPDLRIGISGWTYAPWRGIFFPKGLPQNRELFHASRQVRSIEINGTFYSLQRPSSYQTWYEQTPEDFVFSIKGPRFVTHIKRLRAIEAPLANFFASGVLRLNQKIGPILWQLPPSFVYQPDRLAEFFALLPRDTRSAAKLAQQQHDFRLKHVPWTKIDRNRPLRHALEVRHPSFKTEAFVSLLRQHDIALVVADTAGKWPLLFDVTADFVYVRLHGDAELYVSGYTPEALQNWAEKIRAWSEGRDAPGIPLLAGAAPSRASRDVYVYFDNDVKTHAPFDAMSLAHLLGLAPAPPPMPAPEPAAAKALAASVPRTRWPGYGPRKKKPARRKSVVRKRAPVG
jgi:uncharacterized protein YecE (DUF72 family)